MFKNYSLSKDELAVLEKINESVCHGDIYYQGEMDAVVDAATFYKYVEDEIQVIRDVADTEARACERLKYKLLYYK